MITILYYLLSSVSWSVMQSKRKGKGRREWRSVTDRSSTQVSGLTQSQTKMDQQDKKSSRDGFKLEGIC